MKQDVSAAVSVFQETPHRVFDPVPRSHGYPGPEYPRFPYRPETAQGGSVCRLHPCQDFHLMRRVLRDAALSVFQEKTQRS